MLRTDWPFLEIYYQQTYTKYKIRTEVKIEKRVEREKEGGGGVVDKSSADLMLSWFVEDDQNDEEVLIK